MFVCDIPARLVNALHYGDSPLFCIVMAGYLCVDTFLFLGLADDFQIDLIDLTYEFS